MARTALTATVPPGKNPTAGVVLTMDAVDVSNGNNFTFNANEMLIVRNAHASAAKTVTLTSSADSQGRSGDVTDSLAAGEVRVYGPFRDKEGWGQTGNKFFVDGETTDIKVAVVKLPGF